MALFPISAGQVQLSTDTPVATDTFSNGILKDAANTVARAASSGGVQFSNGVLRTALGQVVYVDATAGLPAGTSFVNGLPITPLGALCISTDVAATYLNGVPFAANGALSVAGLGAPVNPPSGLGYTPSYTITQSGSNYTTNFSMAAVKPTVTHTLYVGSGGDNAQTGLTWALRLRSLKQAITRANALGTSASVVQILVQAGDYLYSNVDGSSIQDNFAGNPLYRKVVIEPCDSSGNVLPISNTTSRIRSIQNQVMPAFSLVGSNVYKSTYTTENPSYVAWDSSNLNSIGNPQALRNAPGTYANEAAIIAGVNAQASLYGQGAVWIDATNKFFYVQTYNNRAPDASIFVGRGNPGDTGSSAANFRPGGMFGATQQVWARNVDFWGGVPLYAYSYVPDGNIFQGWFSDCSFCYGSFNGYTVDNAFNSTLLRCVASDNYKDGANYDMSLGAGTGTFNELDCTLDWNGNDSASDASSNASSAHVNSIGVRVSCRANRTQNRAFHDIKDAKSWNLGCIASNCRQTGVQSGGFASGFLPNTGDTSVMWLDGCQSNNNDYDLEAYKGGTLLYANMNTTGYVNDNTGGTIGTYTPGGVTPTNILLNGDFASGTTNWSGFGFSGKSVSGGKATFAATPAFDGIQQTVAPTVGKYYDITYTLVRTAGDVTPRFIGGTTASGAARASSGTFTDRVQALTGNNAFQFINGSVLTATIDDVSIVGPYDTP